MRLPELLLVIACGILLPVTCVFAEAAEDRGAQEQTETHHQHHDRRHGHNHVYPDRGSIVREMPHGAAIVNYAGVAYRFYEGVWFEPRGPAFMVVTPPIGLIVPSVPAFATVVDADGEPYLYANDVYYRARPDLGGYEVVNDPLDTASKAVTAKSPSPDRPVASGAAATGATAAATTLATTAAATRATAEPAAASQRAAALQAAAAPQSAAAPPPLPSTQSPPPQPLPPPPAPSAGAPMLAPPPPGSIPVPAPPPQPAVAAQPVLAAGVAGGKLYAVPGSAKSQDEQARDHYDCYRFAVAQSGFDPMRTNAPSAVPAGEAEYERAQAACFEARGYAVR